MSRTQSVILNLNKDYSNSKAHDYFQPVSQQLDIGKNAEVCLYGAAIKRQPIFINKEKNDGTYNFNVNPVVYPDVRQFRVSSATATHVIDPDNMPNPSIDQFSAGFNIEAGAYSINEFGQTLVNNINSEITRNVNGVVVKDVNGVNINSGTGLLMTQFPYTYTYENYDNDNFYLGFQGAPSQMSDVESGISKLGKLNNSQRFGTLVNNNEADNSTGALELDYSEEGFNNIDGIRSITANTTISTTDYQAFARIHNASLFPLFRQQKDLDSTLTAGENESYFEFGIDHVETNSSQTTDFIVGFTNTFLHSGWTDTFTPATTTLFPTAETIPQTFMGVKVFEDKDLTGVKERYLELYMANKLTQFENYYTSFSHLSRVWQDGCSRICKIDLDAGLSHIGNIGFRYYAVDNQMNFLLDQEENSGNVIDPLNNSMYSRVYGFQLYARADGEDRRILYDSKQHNIYIPGPYLEDGFIYNTARTQRGGGAAGELTNLGFQPYLFVNQLSAGEGICSPRGNYVAYCDKSNDEVYYKYGMNYYEYSSTNEDLLNVLGIPKKGEIPRKIRNVNKSFKVEKTNRYDGNAYPEFKGKAGHNKLYTDNTQYNIEINLPIKAYNTTQPNINKINQLGQKRTILYKTEPLIEGEIQQINQYYLDKNIVPNNLKFLTLNNSAPLNLNELNVQIRRSKTNELATELEDASVELLIKSE